LYRDELLPHVIRYLFLNPVRDCAHLQIVDSVSEAWFGNLAIDLRERQIAIALEPKRRIEFFLSPQGVGVFCITVVAEEQRLQAADALDVNHALSRFRRPPIPRLRRSHPQDDLDRWKRIPESQQVLIRPRPSPTALFSERLSAPGGWFTLPELIEFLIEPLAPLDPVFVQDDLFVYTVVRLQNAEQSDPIDFGSNRTRTALGPLLAGLAQVEESGHSGAPRGDLSVRNRVMNRHHWAATSSLGAAHLITDQARASETVRFDETRPVVVRDKYFMPYLITVSQQLALHRAKRQAANLVMEHGRVRGSAVEELRADVLDFGLRAYFSQVSSRDALHQYYKLSQGALGISRYRQEVRDAVTDFDASLAARRQRELTEHMNDNLTAIRHVQEFLHTIEYLLFAVYFAHLFHMTSEGWFVPWCDAHVSLKVQQIIDAHGLRAIGTVASGAFGALLAVLINLVQGHHGTGEPTSPPTPTEEDECQRAKGVTTDKR
jgi:hypothetical protein